MGAKNLIIFGNGIGMALDPDYFRLENALSFSWKDDFISADQRNLILSCLSNEEAVIENPTAPPPNEDCMDSLHQALVACDTLREFQRKSGQKESWLTDEGKEFPKAVRAYLNATAYYFLQQQRGEDRVNLPKSFYEPLIEFGDANGVHIATLNYDDLLYECLNGSRLIPDNTLFWQTRDYEYYLQPSLYDSFNQKFIPDHHNNKIECSDRCGWYFHLHGSALYQDENGDIVKKKRSEVKADDNTATTHLVMTHVKHKKSVIETSDLLSYYWKQLESILPQQETVTLIGYSGLDPHLNELLSKNLKAECKVRVVIWRNPKTSYEGTLGFWRENLNLDFQMIRMDNILEYTAWGEWDRN